MKILKKLKNKRILGVLASLDALCAVPASQACVCFYRDRIIANKIST